MSGEEPKSANGTADDATVFQAAESLASISVDGGGSAAAAATASIEEVAVAPVRVEGRGARKSITDILSLDADDESLRKYKESLLGAAAGGTIGDPNDPRRVIVTEFRMMFDPAEGRPDITFALDTPAGIENFKTTGISIKEGCKYKLKISFRVQHEIVAGLKFENKVKTTLTSEKDDLVIGSYPPAVEPHVFEFPRFEYMEAPSGMMYRGTYTIRNQFSDSDGVVHLAYYYDLKIQKTW